MGAERERVAEQPVAVVHRCGNALRFRADQHTFLVEVVEAEVIERIGPTAVGIDVVLDAAGVLLDRAQPVGIRVAEQRRVRRRKLLHRRPILVSRYHVRAARHARCRVGAIVAELRPRRSRVRGDENDTVGAP